MSDRPEGGLDALFSFADEPSAEDHVEVVERSPSRAWWLIRNVLLVVAATVVAEAALRSARIGVSLLLIVAAFVALRLLMLAVAQVAPPRRKRGERGSGRERNRADDDGLSTWTGSDSLRVAVRRWEQRLSWAQSDPEAFSRNVLPVLAELTDERLRLRHGITRASDPRRARELLGDEVWTLLSEPVRRPTKARELGDYLETLERL